MSWLSCIISNVFLASLLALAAWFVQRRLRRHGVARILWLFVLVKLVTPPLLSVPWRESPGANSLLKQVDRNLATLRVSGNSRESIGDGLVTQQAAMACAMGTCGCSRHSGVKSLVRGTWPWVLLAVWSIGAVATGWTAWRRWARFRRLMAHATPAPPEWESLAARLAAELSLRRPPEVLAVPGRLPPLVVAGRRRPRLLLPMALIGQLDVPQRRALLLHELVHIQRYDHLVRMLELTVSVVYWWLPLIGAIGRQLRDCEEACCDAAVLAHLPQARRDYARLLLDVLDFVTPVPRESIPQATAMSAVHDLERRLRTILDATQETRPRWPTGAFAVSLACAILPCGFHYDLVERPSPAAATAVERDPAAVETQLPGDDCEVVRPATLCCPS